MVIDDEKHTIRAEDENKYKQTKIMETQNAKLLFSWIDFGRRLEKFQKGVTVFVNKHSSTTPVIFKNSKNNLVMQTSKH